MPRVRIWVSIQRCSVEEDADVPVPRTRESVDEAVKVVLLEQVSAHDVEQMEAVPLEIPEKTQLVTQHGVKELFVEENIDVLMSQVMEDTIELVMLIPPRRVQHRMLDVPGVREADGYRDKDEANKVKIEGVEVLKVIPQERKKQHTVERLVDVPVRQIVEETVEVAQGIPQEQAQSRTWSRPWPR